ncbi:tetratricopeptide repeat protein [Actinoplanes sp. NPDC049802]|uniref:tetratricopeptide repeat protein n=1 Tax=Actinoplanes sp. NPDC049802 TaxID=3154742 RepID=UPI0033FC7C92
MVVATARSIDGDWLTEVTHARTHLLEVIGLDEAHPHPGQVYERTFAALRPGPRPPLPEPRPGHTWTTLDLVLFGWLAAVSGGALPATRDGLYRQVLDHEQKYWAASWTDLHGGRADRPLLAEAAACLTLLGPASLDAAAAVLTGVGALAGDARWRRDIARTFEICLRQRPGERWAIRPDPIGDHHLLRVLTANPELLGRWLPPDVGDTVLDGALAVLQRAGGLLLADAIRVDPRRWRPVLAIAATQGGPAREALETLAVAHPLPLAEMSELLPPGSAGLWRLGLLVDERRLAEAAPGERADLLLRVARRRSDAGDGDGAVAAAAEAVELHRASGSPGLAAALAELAVQDPAGLAAATEAVELLRAGDDRIALARALGTLANRRFDTGDRAGAVLAAEEALSEFRTDPRRWRPDIALTLANLSRYERSEAAGAEAAEIYRELGALPELATTLNMAVRRSERGDHAGALAALDEVVEVRRRLARINPRAFLPELAASLNNQGNQRSNLGDRAGAVAALSEAAEIYQRVGSPADRAMVLNNLAVERSRAGDPAGALEAVTAAVEQYRLGGPSYELAGALTNLAIERSRSADRESALAAAVEAVGLYRRLGAGPELATALNVLANRLSENGDHEGALIAASEVFLMRREQGDEAGLALTLNNLATHMAAVGRLTDAVEFATEAVDRYRRMNAPSRLAMALHTLAERQAGVGNRSAARAAATEAVAIRRRVGTPAELAQSLTQLGGPAAREAAGIFRRLGMRAELARALTESGDPEAVGILRELDDPLLLPELGRALARAPGEDGPREAVEIFRRLGLRPDLGRALTRLGGDAAREAAGIFRELGLRADLAEALMRVPGDVAAAREAVAILRTVGDDEALARALRNLGDARAWRDAVAERGGRLRADHAAWLAARGRNVAAEITRAAAEASSPEDRRHVWEVALSLGPALGLPTDHLEFIEGWLTAPDWPGQAAVLARHYTLLGGHGLRRTLRRAHSLYADERLEILTMLVDDMGRRGVDVVLADLERSVEEQDAIAAWKAQPSWPASIDHLREHAAILTRPTVQAVLIRSGDPLDRQHATVLRLADRFALDTVLRVLTEPPTTAELALRAVEDGDLALLIDLIPACPAVLELPGDGPFLWAVMLLSAGRRTEGLEVARVAAGVMSDLQVRANRIRLRKMLATPLPPGCRAGVEGFLALLSP